MAKARLKILRPLLRFLTCLAPLVAVALLTACSTKKNTAATRWWQAFTTRYNVYFNGHEAYKEGYLAKEEGNKDNYTELLPLFTVGNEDSRELGSSNFETTVTKCEKAIQLHSIKRKPAVSPNRRRSPKLRAYLSRKEFNPFLKNAWLLMGKAQFQKGDFIEAASTFSYITRLYAPEPLVVSEARAWLARCYTELEWYYDAEDVMQKMLRDTLTSRLNREADASMANLLLRQERFAEALPYLERTVKAERRKKQKARGYYLMGQVYTQLDRPADAYKAYARCLRQSPPYELAFNARIQQTEVLSSRSNARKMISRLKRMARSDNNKDYLDQVITPWATSISPAAIPRPPSVLTSKVAPRAPAAASRKGYFSCGWRTFAGCARSIPKHRSATARPSDSSTRPTTSMPWPRVAPRCSTPWCPTRRPCTCRTACKSLPACPKPTAWQPLTA